MRLQMMRMSLWWFGAVVLLIGEPWAAAHAEGPSSVAAVPSRVEWLRAEIARHDDLYFKKNAPELTDAEYDALKRELRRLEAGAAEAVGDDRTGAFATRVHGEPMLSLEKAYTETELRAFIERTERAARITALSWVVEPKLDGIAISLVYEDRKLVAAVTRGNGRAGDDVTANVLMIAAIPRELPADAPSRVEVRGEIFMTYAEFARINVARAEAGEEPFAHPRNLAAGTLKMVDAGEVAKRRLSAVFFGLGAWASNVPEPGSQEALHALLRSWGFPVVDAVSVNGGADGVWASVEAFGRTRASLPFPTDGVVVKVNARAAQQVLGSSDAAPRWAVAYKYAPERVTTRLRAITLQVGRTGVVTPVAELEPVRVGGSTVARATLHNADEIARRDLRVGDWVFVEKAGEVIPAITGVDLERREADARPFVFPDACADCETRLVRAGAAVRCPNGRCPAQVRKRVEYFASRSGVGIGGLGPALITKLSAAGKLGSVADVYRLKREDGVSARVLVEIERSKTVELPRLITGLGFAGVGKKGAEVLAEKYGSLSALAEAAELSADERALMAELVALGVNSQAAGLPAQK